MSEHLRDLASLQAHYEDVIQTHKDLAVVFSSLVGTVVDGRLPGHDLAAMLKDLAEREELMAGNWGFVRDGLVDKLRRDIHEWTIEVTTDLDSDEEVAEERHTDGSNESDTAVVEQPRRPQKESSIANHLATALANAVKPGVGGNPSILAVRNAKDNVTQDRVTRKQIEREAKWQIRRLKRIKKRDKLARKQAKKDELATRPTNSEGIAQQKTVQESARARKRRNRAIRHDLERNASRSVEDPTSGDKILQHVTLQEKPTKRGRKKAARHEEGKVAKKTTSKVYQHTKLSGLVRANDGRVIKQEPDD